MRTYFLFIFVAKALFFLMTFNGYITKARSAILCATLVCLFSLYIACEPVKAQGKDDFSNQVKSVFIYNFLDFVSWPDNKNAKLPMICVLAEDKVFQILDYIRREKLEVGRPFALKKLKSKDNISNCQVAYIHHSHAAELPDFLEKAKGQPILSVSDIRGFVDRGGIVGFLEKGNKIRLEVNNTLASKNNVKISSKLLKLAENIE